ncbi:hypothetical protein FIV34_04165 [Luteibacter pinisoli]|uniref:XdhC family protein n=1 Tax=Luteibacter pinisoli TaxID=2589080 RepID=A0A4Y5YZX8_9GAMM|nr:XdhC family protein [Luteibacter pinisoli]QDE38451.1 hypothetical protein FIV34_04165 [Luteibacter pinisoli]
MKSITELRHLASALREAHRARSRCALVTIVATTGSTFRRVGAAMLVREDGSVVNALSGGCPQRDLVERAQRVISGERSHYVAYNADHGLDLLLEMGCGGTLEVFIESVGGDITTFIAALDDAIASREPFRMRTHFPAADAGRPVVRRINGSTGLLGDSDEACCTEVPGGGRVLDESFLPPIRLVIAGASPEAAELARAASLVGWHGVVVDAAPERLEQIVLPAEGWECQVARPEHVVASARIDAGTAFVSMTHNLERDIGYLQAARDGHAFYLGALGSRERAGLMAGAVDSTRLHVPAGLDVGSNTSPEIALAVVAEALAYRHRRDGRSLRHLDGAIH